MNSRRRCFCALLLFCLLGLALRGAQVHAAGEPVSLAAYWALVETSRQDIIALEGRPEQDAHAGLLVLAARWEHVRQVRLDDGRLLDIDNSFWVSQFRAEKPEPFRLVLSLDALLVARPKPAINSPETGTAALRGILARPEFQWQQEPPNWLQELINRFLNWLSRLLDQPAPSAPGSLLIQGLGILAVVLVALVLAYMLRGLFADLAADSFLDTENSASGAPLNAQAALTRAEGLSNQGDYRSAVRYLYLSALLILDERGLLYYDRTRTNREYLRDLNSRPQTATLLRAVIEVFDRVWYGFQPVDAETYTRYSEQVNQLKEQK